MLLSQDQIEQACVSLNYTLAHFLILHVGVKQFCVLNLKHLQKVSLDLLRLLFIKLLHVLFYLSKLGLIGLLRFLDLLSRVLAHTASCALGHLGEFTAGLTESCSIRLI